MLVRAISRSQEARVLLVPEIEVIARDKAMMAALFEEGRTRAQANQLKFEAAHLLAQLAEVQKDADTAAEFYHLAIGLNRDPNKLLQLELAKMYLTLHKFQLAIDTCNELLATKRLNRERKVESLLLPRALSAGQRQTNR